ncbi:HTTM domain-containing protein [Corallococcus sp. ZKHCc1 1396]|uniref:HTTM domain-containing protein n=1 Tax=Corallococcus soli TaxID=2710757 RepID=A0ABR9PI57_9BACT|nr:HTTM domain-containing protein [Corallococcus soli]MBE4747603.1 HTTM domain-containing protein [Corallococcus soli]
MSTPHLQRPVSRRRLATFFGAPSSAGPLGIMRIGVALMLLAQAFSISDSLPVLLDDRGLVPWSISEPLASPVVPRLGALVAALAPLGLSPEACVRGLVLLYSISLVGLLLGYRSRLSAVVAWISHTVILNSGPFFAYGVETFAHISLFYCAVMPVGEAFSWDVRVGRASGAPSSAATLALRVLQIHMCIIYFATGLEKVLGPLWREGTAIWKVLMQPQYGQFDFAWLATVPWAVKLASWATLIVEVGYVVFVWPQRTRGLWVMMTLGMHLGIAVMMGLWLFSGMMAVLTFSAFGWALIAEALYTRARAAAVLPFHSEPAR